MIRRFVEVNCDNCGEKITFYNFQLTDVYTAIRDRKWSVSKDRMFTFCTNCKDKMRSVGRNGVNKLLPFAQKKAKYKERMRKFEAEEEERTRKIYQDEYSI